MWLTSVNIPKEQNMQALAMWLKVDPRWLRYGVVLEDSFVVDYLSLSEEDKATVRAVVGVFGRNGTVKFCQSFEQNTVHT